MAQLCHCHDEEENIILLLIENWSGWSRINREPPKKQVCNELEAGETQSSVFYIARDWEAAMQEWSPFSRSGTFRHDWSLQLIKWIKIKPSGIKVLWSDDKKKNHPICAQCPAICLEEKRWGFLLQVHSAYSEAWSPLLWASFPANEDGALHNVNGTMKE